MTSEQIELAREVRAHVIDAGPFVTLGSATAYEINARRRHHLPERIAELDGPLWPHPASIYWAVHPSKRPPLPEDTMPAQGWLIPSGTYADPHRVTDAGRFPAPREENPNMAGERATIDPTLTADSIPEPLGWSEGHQTFGEVAAVAERAKHDREMFVIETTIDTLANRYREAQRAERYLEEKAAQLRTLRAEIVRGLRHFASELDPEERGQAEQGRGATHG